MTRRRNQLTTLPEGFGGLENLKTLDISDCNQLTTLPEGFGDLKNLQTLNLSDYLSKKDVVDSLPWRVVTKFI